MNKFKKMMSVTLASCMAASALMMSAGAANTPVDTGTATWHRTLSVIRRSIS